MTWPAATHLTSAIPGDGFDGWQNYWNQWWIKEALLVKQTHFFFTDILYPPSGTSLLFHTLNFFNGLLTLPLQLNFGLAVAYNAVVLFHFTLAGFGLYLLARYLLARLGFRQGQASWGAAFGAGLIFTFSPFHMAHLLGHMQVFSLTWPPFYSLWLLRTLNEWRLAAELVPEGGQLRGLRAGDLALAGLFLIFTTMVDWYQTLYMLLFTALACLWAGWSVWRDRPRRLTVMLKPALGIAGMGLIFGLLLSPLIVPMALEAATADYMRPTFAENVILSADLLAFFTPSELHPLWGDWVFPLYQTFTSTTSERLVFAGFVPLILGGYAIIRDRQRRLVQFWLIFTSTFFILALGPYLHLAGQIVRVGQTAIPLPYFFLYKAVPFIGISRSLSRFDLMVMLGLGLLTAIGLVRLKPGLQILALALIGFEFLAIPYPMSRIDTPDFFKMIAQDDQDYTIAALPMNWDRPSPLLYQTVHGKKLLTAYTSRQNPLDLTWRTPVLQQWRTLKDDIIEADLAAVAPAVLHDFQVKYIVLDYYQMPPGPEREATEKWVAAALPDLPPSYDDGRLKVYPAPPLLKRRPYLRLGAAWGPLEERSGLPLRWLSEMAMLEVIGEISAQTTLSLETMPPYHLEGIAVSADQTALPLTLSEDGLRMDVDLPANTKQLSLAPVRPLPVTHLQLVSP